MIPAFLCCFTLLAPLGSASGDVLFLEGGGRIKGSIIQANGNIVVVERRGGGIQQVVRKLIAEISVDLENGQTLLGEFVGLTNGILSIQTDAGPIRIRSGHILDGQDEPIETASLIEPSAELMMTPGRPPQERSYVPPPIFIFNDRATIIGRPVAFQSPLLTVRRASGGQQTVRVDELKEVVIRDSEGRSIVGAFIDWSDGVFELSVDGQLVQISHGAILSQADSDVSIGGPLEDLPQVIDDVAKAGLTPSVAPSSDKSGGEPAVVEDEADTILLSVTNSPADEDDAAMLFNVSLSRPTPRDLIIIYTALADTADQDDFTNGNGIAKINAGSDSGKISIPLVDDAIKEGDESFRLFLSSDPKLVKMSSNRIAATIRDND